MESRMLRLKKYIRILITATPFLVPWFLLLVEEMIGNDQGVVWYVIMYTAYAAFVLSLVVLYVKGVWLAISYKSKTDVMADVVSELFMFHFVKIPLFLLAWFALFVLFLFVALCINGFDGIQ